MIAGCRSSIWFRIWLGVLFILIGQNRALNTSAFAAETKAAPETLSKVAPGMSEKQVLEILGKPSETGTGKFKRLIYRFMDQELSLSFQNTPDGKLIQRISEFHPPLELSAIPQNEKLIELQPERGPDYFLPGRLISQPSTGKTWTIGLNGKVESLKIEAPQPGKGSPEHGKTLKELLSQPPPGLHDNVVPRKKERK